MSPKSRSRASSRSPCTGFGAITARPAGRRYRRPPPEDRAQKDAVLDPRTSDAYQMRAVHREWIVRGCYSNIKFPVLRAFDISGYLLFPGREGTGLSHKFEKGVSIVAGINGIGKTTLLNALLR